MKYWQVNQLEQLGDQRALKTYFVAARDNYAALLVANYARAKNYTIVAGAVVARELSKSEYDYCVKKDAEQN